MLAEPTWGELRILEDETRLFFLDFFGRGAALLHRAFKPRRAFEARMKAAAR